MAQNKKHETLQAIRQHRLVGLFHDYDIESALNTLKCCAEGGLRIVEFVNRGVFALDIFTQLSKAVKKSYPDIVLGAGSVIDRGTAAQFINNGADFIVSPCICEDVAQTCNSRKIPYLPGCGTATEIMQAHLLGVDICKLFPGDASGGPGFIKGVMGPMPFAEIMPTGGVEPTTESCSSWLNAGAVCVGMGSKLLDSKLIKNGSFDQLTEKIHNAVMLIQSI